MHKMGMPNITWDRSSHYYTQSRKNQRLYDKCDS